MRERKPMRKGHVARRRWEAISYLNYVAVGRREKGGKEKENEKKMKEKQRKKKENMSEKLHIL